MDEMVIDGFRFSDPEDVKLATEEVVRIRYISEKMNLSNAEGVLAVYDKLVQSGIFVTPVGYEYLRTMQTFLLKNAEIDDSRVREIPVAISYSDALSKHQKKREEKSAASKRTMVKTFRNEYKISLIVSAVLFVMVIAMFVITLKADNPNILNYRTAIENEYAQWEQDLSQREATVREKERELNITAP